MRFETYVALRYLRGKRKNRFVSLITLISVAGVSVGVIALIVVMSVMTGFDNALQETIVGNRSHLTVQEYGRASIGNYEELAKSMMALCPEIVACGPVTQVEALFRTKQGHRQEVSGGFVVGVDPVLEQEVTQLADNLTDKNGRQFGSGRLPGKKEIVLGYRLALSLNARVGTELKVMTARQAVRAPMSANISGLWLTVSGISQAQMSDFDTYYAFVDTETMAMLTGRDEPDAIHCRLEDLNDAEKVAERLETELFLRTTTWYESQQAFFGALKQEKFAMFIILVFIILVAAFNITSTLIMVVMEKRQDIGILRTVGTSGGSILLTFVIEGLFIGIVGTAAGVVSGTLLAYNLNPVAKFVAHIFGLDIFNSQIYYFDRIPVAVMPMDVLWVTVCAVVLTFVSTLYPAWSASRLDPIEALRNE